MDIQAIIDALSAQMKQERSHSQMTIGKLLDRLSELPDSTLIDGVDEPHSYRGYYSDLALERCKGKVTVAELTEMLRGVLGKELTGYKGGEYLMTHDTPVWMANEGETGPKIVALNDDGKFETEYDA